MNEALADELEARAEAHRQKALEASYDTYRYHHQGAAEAYRKAAELARSER